MEDKIQLDEETKHRLEIGNTRVDELDNRRIAQAAQDALLQQRLTVKEALRRYPHAVLWSGLLTCVTLMESYDYGLVSALRPRRYEH